MFTDKPRVSLGLLQLLGSSEGVRLVLASPLGHFAVGFGQTAQQLGFGLLLLVELLPQELTVVTGRLQTVSQSVFGLGKPHLTILNLTVHNLTKSSLD